jgi:hypothetical protein
MVKTFKIKHRKDGQGWGIYGPEIYASSWHEAKKTFTEWVMNWLDEVNNDHGQDTLDLVRKEYQQGQYLDTFFYDAHTYTIKNLDKYPRVKWAYGD